MADQKLTDLTEETTPADTDLLYLVTSGSPAEDRRITRANLLGGTRTRAITACFNNASGIQAGEQVEFSVPVACTITGWTLLADQVGSIQIDIWKDTYANFPPTDADSITGSSPPSIAGSPAARKNQSSSVGDWTTSIAAGDTLIFNVDSASGIERAVLVLTVTV